MTGPPLNGEPLYKARLGRWLWYETPESSVLLALLVSGVFSTVSHIKQSSGPRDWDDFGTTDGSPLVSCRPFRDTERLLTFRRLQSRCLQRRAHHDVLRQPYVELQSDSHFQITDVLTDMGTYVSDPTKKGWLTSILELGAWLGTLYSGFLAEIISRKYAILVNVFIFIVGVVIQCTAVTPSAYNSILAGRFITGTCSLHPDQWY